jgi:hypothetical protein
MRQSAYLLSLLAPALAGCALSPWASSTASRSPVATAPPAFGKPLAAGQLVVHADFSLPESHRMVGELTAERQLICDRLGIRPGSEPIHVYLFADEADYREHVRRQFPGFPERRAIFVETDVKLAVYAHWSDHVADDLRHEVAHGYLHSAVPSLPLWLDEGLAEYFEVGRGRRGVNAPHVACLMASLEAGQWRADLPRLEQLTAAEAMTQLDYAEAWLWVHYLLESPEAPAGALAGSLNALRGDQSPAPLSGLLSAQAGHDARVEAHLRGLAEELRTTARHSPPPG